MAKLAALTDTLAGALKTRGVADLQAILAALVGIAAFSHATIPWIEDAKISLGAQLDFTERESKTSA